MGPMFFMRPSSIPRNDGDAGVPNGCRSTVLVVDDEPVLVEELSEFLIAEGYEVHAAKDGSSALDVFRSHPPGTFTVVLTDLRMPGLTGFSLARTILDSTPDRLAVEIIVITGHGSPSTESEAPRGIFSVVRKPIRLARLQQLIGQACDAAFARRLAASGRPDPDTSDGA